MACRLGWNCLEDAHDQSEQAEAKEVPQVPEANKREEPRPASSAPRGAEVTSGSPTGSENLWGVSLLTQVGDRFNRSPLFLL